MESLPGCKGGLQPCGPIAKAPHPPSDYKSSLNHIVGVCIFYVSGGFSFFFLFLILIHHNHTYSQRAHKLLGGGLCSPNAFPVLKVLFLTSVAAAAAAEAFICSPVPLWPACEQKRSQPSRQPQGLTA